MANLDFCGMDLKVCRGCVMTRAQELHNLKCKDGFEESYVTDGLNLLEDALTMIDVFEEDEKAMRFCPIRENQCPYLLEHVVS